MFNSTMPSLSDIAAVTNNNDGFGNGNSGWWVLIILFALFGGFGRGYGYGGSGGGVTDGYVLASDFATLERKADTINSGLCDGFYAMNTGMLNGFSNTNAAIATGFAGVNNAVCTLGYQNAELINGVNMNIMQSAFNEQANTTALSNQIQQCCCDNKSLLSELRYEMLQQDQAIMQNCNNNYRALHDELVQSQIDAKNAQIAERDARIQALELKASQEAQNNYIVNALRPQAIPAFEVPNPYCPCGYSHC